MKIANKRPIVVFAVSMIAFLLMLLYLNSSVLRICLISIGVSFFLIGLVLCAILKHPTLKLVFSRVFIVALACLTALGSVVVSEKLFERDKFDYAGYAVIEGRVASVGDFYNGNYRRITLDDVTISTDSFEKNLHYKARFVILCDGADEDIFTIGNRILADAKVEASEIYYVGDFGLSFNYRINNISCSGYAVENDIVVINNEPELKVKDMVHSRVKEIVEGSLDAEYQGLALGMLFGDDGLLDQEIGNDFSATGIAHLLAVSGLHVGFLVALLVGLCKLCRIKGIFKFLLISAILIFYGYLCGFTASVSRAIVMAICMLYAGLRYKHYDSLNALALSAIINLIISPFSLSSVGFLLSYSAVLGIILLARPLTKVLSYVFKEKLANTFATILSVQIGTTGIMVMYFNEISLVSIVANFVSIPLASFAYMILFATVALSFVFPFLQITVYLFQFVMQFVVKFVHLLAQVKLLNLAKWKGTALTATVVPAMYVSSNYLFLNKYIKLGLVIASWLTVLIILFL